MDYVSSLENRVFECLIKITSFYRQVPIKPRLACPVKCEAYLTRVRGEHHLHS